MSATRFSVVVSPFGTKAEGISYKYNGNVSIVAYTPAAFSKIYNGTYKAYYDGAGITTVALLMDAYANNSNLEAYSPAPLDNVAVADVSGDSFVIYTGAMFNGGFSRFQVPLITPILPYLAMPATASTLPCAPIAGCAATKIPGLPMLTNGNSLGLPTKTTLGLSQQQAQSPDPVALALELPVVSQQQGNQQPFQ